MDAMTTRSLVTNQKVADDLGCLTHSAVSRIRSGDRLPSLSVIKQIESKYNWDLRSQVGMLGPSYAPKFEEMLARHYGE